MLESGGFMSNRITVGMAVVLVTTCLTVAVSTSVASAASSSTSGSITCGSKGHAAYTIAFARHRGLSTASKGPGPTAKSDVSARVAVSNMVGDPDAGNSYSLPEVAFWTFQGNLPNINFGASQIKSGGGYTPQFAAKQCSGQSGATGTVTKSYSAAHVSCPAGKRPVVWSDGWGNHWVYYRSTKGGAIKRVKTMTSNYGTLRMGSLFINEREVFDVKLFATTSKPRNQWPEQWIPSHRIGCNTDGSDPKVP
jgi:hypothetical protein